MKPSLCILTLVLCGSVISGQTTNFIASPFNSQNNYGTDDPFLFYNDRTPSSRYQQVYASSDFLNGEGGTVHISGPHLITQITFTTGAGFLDVTLNNIQIDLSTTLKQPDGLSTTFSVNIGTDDLPVYAGAIRLFSPGFGSYNVQIPLQHAFLYNPDLGNLLLDVRNFQTLPPGSANSLMGAAGTLGDSSSLAVALDVNSPTALLGTGALLTEFTVTDVPEPGTVLLLLVALGGFVSFRFIRPRLPGACRMKGNANVLVD
jgi:hypothetical protein